MKRILLYILVISFLLSGCTAKHVDETAADLPTDGSAIQNEPISVIPESTTPVYMQQPMIAISMPLVTEYTSNNDAVVYYYTYQDIYLSLQDQQVADTIIINFLNRLDQAHRVSQDLAQHASDTYSASSTWNPYFMEYIYSPTRIDSSVLSLFGRNVIYTGGQHAELEGIAANYNMITGEVLTLGSILCHIDAVADLCSLTIERLSESEGTLSLFKDYTQVVTQRFLRDASYDEDWYFTKDGLVFYFAPYEIAPYTSGVITVEIPYDKLTNIIEDEFFPAETDFSEGKIIATTLSEINLDNFTQITELQLNSDGEHIFLYCEGLVRNVQIKAGELNEGGADFLPKCTVWAAATLSPGDGVAIQTHISDTQPTIQLSYYTGNEYVVQYISQSGNDGSILLTAP